MPSPQCVFCGCRETSACIVRVRDLAPAEREYYEAVSGITLKDSESVGCRWASLKPPVCTSPRCQKRYDDERARLVPIPAGEPGRECSHCSRQIWILPDTTGRRRPYTPFSPLGIEPTAKRDGLGSPHRCPTTTNMRRGG
ncbi:MAG: hypothetical protein JWO05_1116 [Gemmatimonadetes bacterium]|nr:hypothetical protein [Gemmatimonadota bacterium]